MGHFLYTHLAMIGSPTRVETENISERVYGLTFNWTANMLGVTKKRVDLGSNNA